MVKFCPYSQKLKKKLRDSRICVCNYFSETCRIKKKYLSYLFSGEKASEGCCKVTWKPHFNQKKASEHLKLWSKTNLKLISSFFLGFFFVGNGG